MYQRRSTATIESGIKKPRTEEIYEVDIHHQQCPVCGAIGSIQGGGCGSCGVSIRLVDSQLEGMDMEKVQTKKINPKHLKTAADVLCHAPATDNPIERARALASEAEGTEDIVFEESAQQLTEEQYSVSILKQLKNVIQQNAGKLNKFYSKITITLDPQFEFKVAKKPKELVI